MDTLLLDTVGWDLCVDANGNIAVASDPYSLAQDAASAMRTFQGEAYYDTSLGVPYWTKVMGKAPPLSLVKALLGNEALRVPGVSAVKVFVSGYQDRKVTGQVQLFDSDRMLIATTSF